MSKEGIWQDSSGMKDSEMVEKWTKVLHTVEDAMEQLKYQKTALIKKRIGRVPHVYLRTKNCSCLNKLVSSFP